QRKNCLQYRLGLSAARGRYRDTCDAEAPVIGPVAAQSWQILRVDLPGSFANVVEGCVTDRRYSLLAIPSFDQRRQKRVGWCVIPHDGRTSGAQRDEIMWVADRLEMSGIVI